MMAKTVVWTREETIALARIMRDLGPVGLNAEIIAQAKVTPSLARFSRRAVLTRTRAIRHYFRHPIYVTPRWLLADTLLRLHEGEEVPQ
jgi:hypothetical protein